VGHQSDWWGRLDKMADNIDRRKSYFVRDGSYGYAAVTPIYKSMTK